MHDYVWPACMRHNHKWDLWGCAAHLMGRRSAAAVLTSPRPINYVYFMPRNLTHLLMLTSSAAASAGDSMQAK